MEGALMDLLGIWRLDLPAFGIYYHDYLLYLTVILPCLTLLVAVAPNVAVRIAEKVWAAAGLDVIFELALRWAQTW